MNIDDIKDYTEGSITEGAHKEHEKEKKYTQTSPELSSGDVDAEWEEADREGSELPGGGNETPDEDDVDSIGKSVGESYEDTEPLDPTKKEKPSEY